MIIKNLLKEFLCVGMLVTSVLGTSIPLQAQSKEKDAVSSKSTNTYYPNVQSYEKKDNKTFKIGDFSRLYVVKTTKTDNNEILLKDMKLMSSYFLDKKILTKAPDIVYGDEANAVSNDIVIKMEEVPELVGKEQSYKIDISDKIIVTAKDEVGIYYGLITIIQMLQTNEKILNQGTILDYPDVKDRSFHLDTARKYFTKEWIISEIKDLSWQKYTSLQFHFSENEGYRLESDVLKAKGVKFSDPYFTKKDMLDIIKVANEYHIEIIPSLDSPGHLGKILEQLPSDYNCSTLFPNDARKAQCFNIFTNPEAKQFLIDFMTEFIEFFGNAGCKHFNFGGDEFLAKFENFSNEQYGQIISYFNEVAGIIKKNGMTPRAWNDGLLYGTYSGYEKLDSDIEICFWEKIGNAAQVEEFVKNGNKVLNYRDNYMYFVLSWWWQNNVCPDGDKIFAEWAPTNIDGFDFTGQNADMLAGGSYAIWCDSPSYYTEQQVKDKIYHRTRATAYKMWNNPKELPSYDNVKNAFDKIGRVPGFETALVEPGNVYKNNESVAVTLKYVDQNTKEEIAPSESFYGLKGDAYSFETKNIYGYKYLNASSELKGTYDKNLVITFNYELHCNKDDLQKALSPKLVEKEYIAETYTQYKQSYVKAQQIFEDKTATQLTVDQAVKELNDAKAIVVKKEYFPLYAEVTYPLQNTGYVSGYTEYKNTVKVAKQALYSTEFNVEKMQEQMNALNTAKNNLVKDSTIKPTVSAPIGGYSDSQTTYRPENMVDGNRNTKYWSNGGQNENQNIVFTFPQEVGLKGIEIVYPSNITEPVHDNIKGADIQISLDGNDWKTIGKMTENDFTKKFTFELTKAKYARIHFTKTSGSWLQLAEVVFDMETMAEDNSLKDLISRAEAIDITGKNVEVVDAFIQALIDAQKVNATGTTDIKEAKDNLEKAIANLEKPVIEETKVIFSIDAGRKYFSKDQLKQIIKKAHDCGYTDVELILGNDGLRFALNDMTLTVNGKTYASDAVKKAITAGNNAYYKDPNGDYLTETEMDEILAYAKKLNIGIIPVINSPGHMDAMLVAMKTLGIQNPMFQNSKRTVDLNNAEAIAFNKEMIKKYVTYFAKQSKIFNFGCDEYANDVDTGGWAKLQTRGDYPKFVAYVNDLAKIIKDAGMKPMCFNDGIYYNSKDNYGTFDQDIIISYWTSGWSGFYVASANYLHNKGHKIINTNDGWYWVLGHINKGGYNFTNAMKNIKEKTFNQIVGDRKNTPSIGSMQAVWCDEPSQAHDMPRIMELMDAFSNKHSNVTVKYANYGAVDKAIEKVPADTSCYTKESVDALNKALADVDWTLKADQQDRVDAMAKAIEDAIAGLQVNKDELIAEIAKEPKEDWKYTSASWKAYQTALKNAKKVANDDKATPTQVKEATKALQDAYKGLVENEELTPITPSIKKGALKEAINQKPKYEEDAYTKASWKAYQEALEKANKVLANEKATQKEIDDATKALQDAYAKLKENPDLTPLEPSKPIIPLTPIGPSEQVIPMVPLTPSTQVDTAKPEKPSTTDKIESGEKPNTGVSTNVALLWSILLGAGVVVIATVKHHRGKA